MLTLFLCSLTNRPLPSSTTWLSDLQRGDGTNAQISQPDPNAPVIRPAGVSGWKSLGTFYEQFVCAISTSDYLFCESLPFFHKKWQANSPWLGLHSPGAAQPGACRMLLFPYPHSRGLDRCNLHRCLACCAGWGYNGYGQVRVMDRARQ